MKVNVFQQDGGDSGRSVTLDKTVFGIEPNDHTIWLDVRRIQASGRQGTHKTKERNEIAGSTRKLYRQKGTGHARAGDIKSPLRRGGGTIFGPRPRNYGIKVNKKTSQLARRSVLSHKAKADAIRVVEDFKLEEPDTNRMQDILAALELADKKVLLLTTELAPNLYRSGRNIPRFNVQEAATASTFDLLNAQVVLIQEGAAKVLSEKLGTKSKK